MFVNKAAHLILTAHFMVSIATRSCDAAVRKFRKFSHTFPNISKRKTRYWSIAFYKGVEVSYHD